MNDYKPLLRKIEALIVSRPIKGRFKPALRVLMISSTCLVVWNETGGHV